LNFNFESVRLWLKSAAVDYFPAAVLQKGEPYAFKQPSLHTPTCNAKA
jgi:hypothetical protein